MKTAMKTRTAKTAGGNAALGVLRVRRPKARTAKTARAESAFGMWLKHCPNGEANWDAIESALAENKRARIKAARQMADRWRWNAREKCWEKGPAA